jgi:hypothetical protein
LRIVDDKWLLAVTTVNFVASRRSASQPPHIQDKTFLLNIRNTSREEAQSHANKTKKHTFYQNEAEKNIGRRTTHNHYIQIKYKKIFYKHL